MTDVTVIGGGIGGLSAAQELAERGLDVTVYEANDRFGGKARSVPVSDAPDALHGEHGFRFFPGFYRHVTDTMARIPYRDRTVADNLVPTEETLVARIHGEDRRPSTRTPQSVRGWLEALRPNVASDLPAADVRFFAERLLYVLTSCERRRERELDRVSWWEFIDAENRSRAYQTQLGHSTQSLVALRPERGSARTIGTIYLQLLRGQLDPSLETERVLNGPTSETWIDPWVAHLESLGVDLNPGTPVAAVDADGRRVTGVELADGGTVTADQYVLAVPVEALPEVVTEDLRRAAPSLARAERLETGWMNGVQFFLSEDVQLARGHSIYSDSPWALTAVSQPQFWTEFDVERRGPDEVEGVLSVIASDWETPGVVHGKPARECTPAEIREEVWAQLTAHLDGDPLSEEIVVDWFLDPAIEPAADGEGVRNRSPLLVNTVGSLRNRPDAATEAPNLTLAADYVRTNTDLASMEGANEAARRATNAVLDRAGVDAAPCEVWELAEPSVFDPLKRQDAVRYRLGLPHPGDVSQSMRQVVRRLRA